MQRAEVQRAEHPVHARQLGRRGWVHNPLNPKSSESMVLGMCSIHGRFSQACTSGHKAGGRTALLRRIFPLTGPHGSGGC